MTGDHFIYCLMAMNLGAGVTYAWQGQHWKALYWLAALLLNLCVLRMK